MAQTGKHTAHTPGPWVSRLATASVPTTQVYSSTGHVASAMGKNHEANARLIAAAPEMLSELKRDLQFAREMRKLMEVLKGRGWVQYELAVQRIEALETIIARAEGR